MLASLIARLSDKKVAPVLLVRLADILSRQGHDQEAYGLYRMVADNFGDNKASQIANLRLNDRDFLRVTPSNYRRLADKYAATGRFVLKFLDNYREGIVFQGKQHHK